MIKLLFITIALIFPEIAISNVYRYVAPNGEVYYTDEPPNNTQYKEIVRTKVIVQTRPTEKVCTEKPITKSQINAVKKHISNKLNDPYSAHFKWSKNKSVCKFMDITTITYCGFVNYKNKFGGYIGYIPFKVNLAESKNGWKVEIIDSGEHVYCDDIDE